MSQLTLCAGTLTDLEVREIYLLGREADLLAYIRTDFDKDGMVDWWEREHFGDVTADPGDDPDRDELDNLQEIEAGTDPNAPDTDGDGMPMAMGCPTAGRSSILAT